LGKWGFENRGNRRGEGVKEENTKSKAYEEEGEEQLEEDVSVGEGKVLLQIIGPHFVFVSSFGETVLQW